MRNALGPSLAVVIGGALWGVLWIPFRMMAERGVDGAWGGFFTYVVMAVVLAPLLWHRGGAWRGEWRMTVLGGLFTGTAFSLYAISLNHTEVVRVLLLFYVTPVWSTLIGVAFLGERATLSRIAALALGLGGLMVVFGVGARFPLPENFGDWLALFSGFCWSVGSVFLFSARVSRVLQQMSAFVAGALAVSAAAIWLGVAAAPVAALGLAWPVVLLTAALALPAIFLTLWPANLLSPARLGVLLMSEVLVGVATAAWLAGEPFGPREMIGTALIIAAGLVEVLGKPGKV
ncbi:DMT family transporter [uncultured Litoreibacter sp.]|uniref:DMT family transporter n=1 Tax=uncultured Litoreibacter sp. TaxID=1392394 RepID=UPI0026393E4A|nr:DMT family transporter [uncultured Litoreibacter sp.]